MAKLLMINEDEGELECSECGVQFTLSWVRDPTVDGIRFCPFCGEEVAAVQRTETEDVE